uniref:Uncharacterized protein n=1 Tax=Mola mola TaxID=94237 RepID=A0A3Q4ABF2_MOLML
MVTISLGSFLENCDHQSESKIWTGESHYRSGHRSGNPHTGAINKSSTNSSITLPCRFHQEPENDDPARIRIKWTKVTDVLQFQDVFVALGRRQRVFGPYRGRVFLEQAGPADASVIIQNVTLEDYGRYECQEVKMQLLWRYKLNYHQAEDACKQLDAILASHAQLHEAWLEGPGWCNAGWLADGSVQYPISHPRDQHGRKHSPLAFVTMATGTRRMSVMTVSASLKRMVVTNSEHPTEVNYAEAAKACIRDGSVVAKVGQLYAAWKFQLLDRCKAGGWQHSLPHHQPPRSLWRIPAWCLTPGLP